MSAIICRRLGFTRFRSIRGLPLLPQRVLGGWEYSETAFLHSGLPFSAWRAHRTRAARPVGRDRHRRRSRRLRVPRWSAWDWRWPTRSASPRRASSWRAGADPRPARSRCAFSPPSRCFVFGFVWSAAVGRFGPRELDAFWPTLFLFGYALAGLWFGAAFAALGLAFSALVVAGYSGRANGSICGSPSSTAAASSCAACGCGGRGDGRARRNDPSAGAPAAHGGADRAAAFRRWARIPRLKSLTGATDGNLGAHIDHLARAGYVEVAKAFVGKRPRTGQGEPGRTRRLRPPCRVSQEIIAQS